MIKTIFFDFGGVISGDNNSWDTMHQSIKDETGLSKDELEKIFRTHWTDISVGKKSFIEFLKDLAVQSKKSLTAEHLLEMFDKNTKINNELVNIIKDLKKKGQRVTVLSNDSDLGETFRLKKVESFVDKIYSSASLKLRKPDPEIYKLVLKLENITPEEALFIDDKERNIVAAEALGIKSILYKSPEHLLSELKKYLG